MEDWKLGPPILVGERVVWVKNSEKPTESGVVRWIGKLSRESGDWTVGVELDKTLPYGGTDGSWGNRRLFHCSSRKGVFLPLSRIRKEVTKQTKPNTNDDNFGTTKGWTNHCEDGEMESRMTRKTLKEVTPSSDSDDQKSDTRKTGRRRRKRNKSPRAIARKEDSIPRRLEARRPISVTGRINEDDGKSKWNKKHESCALEEKYIREFIQREISKQQGLQDGERKMNDVEGNFKRIDEDEIHSFGSNRMDPFQYKPPKKLVGRRSDAYHRREKSNGFFSFLKWFKKSKEMPELEPTKDSSVTSSPLFIRRRSSSCGSVDTLFSIATANSFAFVSPVQYQAVISSSHTTYPVTPKTDDEAKSKSQSDYENNPVKESAEGQCSVEKRKKCRAPDPPVRDISLPSTLEHKKANEEDDGKGGHRRTVSESFKDKKAGYYCHVQGKRKAPLPPPSAPLYPSLTSLKSQCPSISKKKRPAPPPPDISAKNEKVSEVKPVSSNYDNLSFLNEKSKKDPSADKEVLKSNSANFSPLLGLTNDSSSSPLPSRPWYKRSSSGSNLVKKESSRFGDRKKNKENEEWMPEVGFSRRPISNESGHNLFNLLVRLDRNSDKKKEEKRKSQISILANISELDREAAEIVRKEHAQEKKMMADKDEKYYTPKNVLASFPSMHNGAEVPKATDKATRTTKNPFDEFKRKNELEPEFTKTDNSVKNNPKTDASAELDYYINPWNCPKCTFENFGWEKFCEACFTMRVKFRPDGEEPAEAKEAKAKEAEVKPAAETSTATKPDEKKEEATPEKPEPASDKRDEEEEPAEDNLEGVRRKRLAFFTSKQSSSSDRGVELEDDETSKLKMMLKEMKDSLPKCEKGVINKAPKRKEKDVGGDGQDPKEANNLKSQGETSDDGDPKTKVQQTWQPIANDPNKYGAIKKVKPSDAGTSTTAEAIIVTKTTVLEDIIIKKGEKVSTSVQTKATVKNDLQQNPKGAESTHYANIDNIKEKTGVVDLSAPESTLTNGDIEVITAKLRKEGAGSADYKVDIQATSSTTEMNTLDVNRLLRKLEAAINTGQHLEAANIAKELARMKVSCSVKRQKLVPDPGSSKIVVDLFVEDKHMHKGPIQIQIHPSITLGQLKMKVEREWGIPRDVQRWILGKQLATDDALTLEQQGVVSNSCPLFLYIVTPEQSGEQSDGVKNGPETDKRNGKVPIAFGEARRPSLIIEEGESACDETDDEGCVTSETASSEGIIEDKPKLLSTPGAHRREMFRRRDSQTSFSFEKREMNENLKKELKVISANSVKERIEQLNRAATGGSADNERRKIKGDSRSDGSTQKWHYNELMQLENADLVLNVEDFECPICLVNYAPGEGVVLKDCLHVFCRTCLVNTIQFNEEAEVKCPYRDEKYSCESVLQQREIKSLVPKGIFEQHLAKSVSVAENNIGNAYHCKTPDCKGWCILEDNVNEFRCPVCRITNCLTCQSIHTGMNCRQYQEQIQFASDTNVEAKKTRDMLQEMVEKGEAMACPTCQVVLMKKWGCDWLRCSMCKTEICWVTRGPRWGPGGKGDTSGGCQCGVNGIKCHPKCNYCH